MIGDPKTSIVIDNGSEVDILEKDYQIKVCPNPTDGRFLLTQKRLEVKEVRIFNAIGQQIIANRNELESYAFDLSTQANGVYLVQVETNKGWFSEKVIIVK